MTAAPSPAQKGKEAQPDQDTLDIVWESLSDAVGRNDGIAHGTDTARYLIEALAERGMCVAPVELPRLTRAMVAFVDVSLDGALGQGRDTIYLAGVSDVELTPDGSVMLSHVRAALKTPRE